MDHKADCERNTHTRRPESRGNTWHFAGLLVASALWPTSALALGEESTSSGSDSSTAGDSLDTGASSGETQGDPEFICGDGKAIPLDFVCDEEFDCDDRTDELTCDYPKFECDDGTQLPQTMKCDGELQCEDASDESDCDKELFHCGSESIPQGWTCDGEADCEGAEDEVNCESRTKPQQSPIEAGTTCPVGGIALSWGYDYNLDGILSELEISGAENLCYPGQANTTLANVLAESPGVNCAAGGFSAVQGTDLNANGVLETSEIQTRKYACNQATGDSTTGEGDEGTGCALHQSPTGGWWLSLAGLVGLGVCRRRRKGLG